MTSDSRTTAADARAKARSVSDSRWFENAIRIGLGAYGIMHILIGWLGLQLAFGDRQGAPSQQGALHVLAQQPGGELLLWATGLGLFFLAVWQLILAAWGHSREEGVKRAFKRIGSVGMAVLFTVLGYSAIMTATAGSSTANEDSLTRRLLELPGGQLIVISVGVVIGIVGAVDFRRGVTTSFDDQLKSGAFSGSSGAVVKRLGQIGHVSKGIALGVLGGLFVWAGATYEPSQAGGLDTALRTLLNASVGPWLLVVVAAGIVAFGLYCFAWARYADTST
jgi:uncharacterized membrane protein YhdT